MDAKTQIIVLLFSFIYGFLFYSFLKLNEAIIKRKNKSARSLITIMFMYNVVLIYILIVFKINNGNFHPYFFIMIILGIYSNIKFTQKIRKNVKLCAFLEKVKKRCYTKEK